MVRLIKNSNTVEIDKATYECLDNIRKSKLINTIKQVQSVLQTYYPEGTEIFITKDNWGFYND